MNKVGKILVQKINNFRKNEISAEEKIVQQPIKDLKKTHTKDATYTHRKKNNSTSKRYQFGTKTSKYLKKRETGRRQVQTEEFANVVGNYLLIGLVVINSRTENA